jgi:exonuclease SbcC
MKLISLDLKNFRQHIDSTITFADGVTGIIGPNGAGKTTILEAIAWALYGAPAVRGTNDTIRSSAAQGGSKASVTLVFELSGQVYKVTRVLDGSGRSGQASLEVNGKPLRSGMSEVSDAITRILGMDYRAFFTSFFTGQKQLEFMAQLDGRQRAAAISRMLGYDRLIKARDQANEDRKGLQREIEGLEKGLANPEELKERRKEAEAKLAVAEDGLREAEAKFKLAKGLVEQLKPLKETSEQKAKQHDELTRKIELAQADIKHLEAQQAQLSAEQQDLANKAKELESLQPDLERYEKAGKEYRELSELQKYESERQQLGGQISALERDIKSLELRAKQLADVDEQQTKASILLNETESALSDLDEVIRTHCDEMLAHEHSVRVRIEEYERHHREIEEKRACIAEAGAEGNCPLCERPLGDELGKVLGNFDAQMSDLTQKMAFLRSETKKQCEAMESRLRALEVERKKLADQVEELKRRKTDIDALAVERDRIAGTLEEKKQQLADLRAKLVAIPTGFDLARFQELRKIGEELRPVRDRAVALRAALERLPLIEKQTREINAELDRKKSEVASAQETLGKIAFSPEEHIQIIQEFDHAMTNLNDIQLETERRRGEVAAAKATLTEVKREEDAYNVKIENLKAKRAEHLHLQVVSEALDRLRTELNDRIRPELEVIAGELLDAITDGRYNTLRINEDYRAVIKDEGEDKPVISGGEEDIVNLALRLAISQMIADRAGQPFSLLVLDEVFGSLDDTRRDNVIALLQNLKNRFEQIILITHIESIHDAVDNCLWVEFDERTKTSRLSNRFAEAVQLDTALLS